MKLVKKIDEKANGTICELFYKKESYREVLNTVAQNKDALEYIIEQMSNANAKLTREMDLLEKAILPVDLYKKFDYSYKMNFEDSEVEFETLNVDAIQDLLDAGFVLVDNM